MSVSMCLPVTILFLLPVWRINFIISNFVRISYHF